MKKVNILIIQSNQQDYEKVSAQLLSSAIHEYELFHVFSIKELCEIQACHLYDIILCDVDLEGVKGLDAVSYVSQKFRDTPIIVICPKDDPKLIRYCAYANIETFTTKQSLPQINLCHKVLFELSRFNKDKIVRLSKAMSTYKSLANEASHQLNNAVTILGMLTKPQFNLNDKAQGIVERVSRDIREYTSSLMIISKESRFSKTLVPLGTLLEKLDLIIDTELFHSEILLDIDLDKLSMGINRFLSDYKESSCSLELQKDFLDFHIKHTSISELGSLDTVSNFSALLLESVVTEHGGSFELVSGHLTFSIALFEDS